MTGHPAISHQEIQQDDSEANAIGEIFQVLWRKKYLIIIVTFIIAVLGITYIFQLVPRYTATTTLLIEDNQKKAIDIESLIVDGYSTESDMIGIMETFKSREMAKPIVEILQLDKIPEFNPSLKKAKTGFLSDFHLIKDLVSTVKGVLGIEIQQKSKPTQVRQEDLQSAIIGAFLGKLKVKQLKSSKVLYVSFESEDPALAAKVANTVAEQYGISQLEAKFQETKKASDWLQTKLADLKDNVNNSERAVENYRQQKGLGIDKNNIGLTEQQFSSLNSQLIAARAEAGAAQARYNQYRQVLSGSEGGAALPEVMKSPIISGLKQEEAKLQGKFSDLSTQLMPSHPKVIQAQAELASMNDRIKGEIEKFVSASYNELALANSHVAALNTSLEEYKSKTGENRKEEITLRALQREAEANKTLYETFLTRFKETTSTQDMQSSGSRIISKAEVPGGPSFPNTRILVMATFLGALILSVALVFLIESLNPGLRTPEQVEDYLKVHTFGIVPLNEGKLLPHEYILAKPHSMTGEAINSIRVSLAILNPDEQIKSILVTSSLPSEGKSTLSVMLARMAAQAGQKVLLIDVDLRRPAVEKMLKFPKKHLGLTDVLMRPELNVHDLFLTDQATGLKVLLIGQTGYINASDLISSQRMKMILNELEQHFDLIILDSPPVMAVTDAKILTGMVDKTLFVVKWDSTPKKVARTALKQLSRNQMSNVAGVVFQQVDMKQFSSYSDSGYSYPYGKNAKYYVS